MRQQFVFTAEGNYEDFIRSGMSDFNTFVMEDFLGAGFFHLLLSPLFAAVIGGIGSVLGKGLVQLRNMRRN
jgi:Fe2+ transport system protein B